MIVNGMSWWQAWLCIWLGYGVMTPFIILSGRPGAVFHVTFPVVNRASFGIFGSLWCVFNRAAMAMWVCDVFFVPRFIHLVAVFGTGCNQALAVHASW